MALFVHIAASKDRRAIQRAGLRAQRIDDAIPQGVYAMPVVPAYLTAHQWVRELKRGGQRQMCGVSFRVPDAEPVWVGRYNQAPARVTAAEALALVMRLEDARGYQVIIPRPVAAQAIVAIRDVPHVGWRYYPSAHGRRPCGCPACLGRGEIRSRRIRRAYDEGFK